MNVILKVIKLYKTPPLHGFVNFWLELQLVTIYQHYRKEHQKAYLFKPISLHKNSTDTICKLDGKEAKSLGE